MEKTGAKIEFIIYNDEINHYEISNIIGYEPTLVYNKGDYIRENLYRKESVWEYSTAYIDTLYIDDILEKMYLLLNPNVSKLSEYIKNNNLNVKFCIVINIVDGQTPSLIFTQNFIQLCSKLNAIIDADMYVLGSAQS